MTSKYFRKGPQGISENITKATTAFKWKVFFAMLGLLFFFLIYFGLIYWFISEGLNIFSYLQGDVDNPFYYVIAGLSLFVLALFMVKSLVSFSKRTKNPYREISVQDEPELVAFIHATADEVGAPKPHKIYISDRVNASVSYDLSLLNILIPSKKNLEIGMGLVNVVNLSEFKAILAHEFGHFAQRSMLLGRYVYVAHQIAWRLVNKRDALDKGLAVLSSIDLRIAWIGWILSIIVWSIRAFIEVLFSIVVVSERALSREMEYQADKVAVSATGSDAIVLALHKLQAADQAYHESISILDDLLQKEVAIENLYPMQKTYIDEMRRVLDDPSYGLIPENAIGENVTIFKDKFANPPEMWATHPADSDREKNAKSVYIPSDIDKREATLLFQDVTKRFEETTELMLKRAEVKYKSKLGAEESVDYLKKVRFSWAFLSNEYKGLYLNRDVFSHVDQVHELYGKGDDVNLDTVISELYPESIKEVALSRRELNLEIRLLEAILNEPLTAEKRKIFHRGERIRKGEIPEILNELRAEEEALSGQLRAHDFKCRTVSKKIADSIAANVSARYTSFLEVLHITENFQNGLSIQFHQLQQTLQIAFADGNVSESELNAIINDGYKLHKVMSSAAHTLPTIKGLGDAFLKKLEIESMDDLIGSFELNAPDHGNIEYWMNNHHIWFNRVVAGVNKLHNNALDELLVMEKYFIEVHQNNAGFKGTTESIQAPKDFVRTKPDKKTERTLELSTWDKFHSGSGIVPTAARFVAAASIIFLAIYATFLRPEVNVYLQNGFDTEMIVNIDGKEYFVDPNSHVEVRVKNINEIKTTTVNGRVVDRFKPDIDSKYGNFIYNIGGGSYLLSYEVGYGNEVTNEPIYIGAKRWVPSRADYILREPDKEIYSRRAETRVAITTAESPHPSNLFQIPNIQKYLGKLCKAHLMWDSSDSYQALQWIEIASTLKNGKELLETRLNRHPREITTHRNLMDVSSPKEKAQMVQEYWDKFERTKNADYLYLSIRAMEDDAERDNAFIEGFENYKENNWLAYAAGVIYGNNEDWKQSLEAFGAIDSNDPVYQYSCELHTRVRRLYSSRFGNTKWITDSGCEETQFVHSLESGKATDDYDAINRSLIDGEIESVKLQLKSFSKEDIGATLPLIAASSGDHDEIVKQVMSDGLTYAISQNMPAIIGLWIREGKNPNPAVDHYLQLLSLEESWEASIKDFVKHIEASDLESAKKSMEEIDSFIFRTYLKTIACIAMENKVPKSWFEEVNCLLFFYERPYFKY